MAIGNRRGGEELYSLPKEEVVSRLYDEGLTYEEFSEYGLDTVQAVDRFMLGLQHDGHGAVRKEEGGEWVWMLEP